MKEKETYRGFVVHAIMILAWLCNLLIVVFISKYTTWT